MRRPAVFLAGVALGLPPAVMLFPGPALAEDSVSYSAVAASEGLRITLQAANSPVTDMPFDAGAAVAQAELDSVGSSRALAATPFPGPFVIGGPGLLAGFTGGAVSLPAYPFVAQADHPTVPEAVVDGPGGHLEARATEGRSAAVTATGMHSEGAAGGFVRSAAATELRAAEVVSTATSDIAGFGAGPVRIGELHSAATARSRPDGTVAKASELRMEAFSVAGTAVRLTPQGVTVADTDSPLPGPEGLDEALRAAGISIAYLAPVETASSIVSAGLMITAVAPPEPAGPGRITYLFGRSVASLQTTGTFGQAAGPAGAGGATEPAVSTTLGVLDPERVRLRDSDLVGAGPTVAELNGSGSAASIPSPRWSRPSSGIPPVAFGGSATGDTPRSDVAERSAFVLQPGGLAIDTSRAYAAIVVAAALAALALGTGTVLLRKPGSFRKGA